MWMARSYKLVVTKDGDQIPVMNLAPAKFDPISYVFCRNLAKAGFIHVFLNKIRNLVNDSDFIRIEAEDKCELIIKKETTEVSGYFNEFEAFEIPTSELIKLVEEWYQFLIYYEEGNIPGIIPESKKQELVIVPLSAVKEEYLNDKRENPK